MGIDHLLIGNYYRVREHHVQTPPHDAPLPADLMGSRDAVLTAQLHDRLDGDSEDARHLGRGEDVDGGHPLPRHPLGRLGERPEMRDRPFRDAALRLPPRALMRARRKADDQWRRQMLARLH
jgi:hypothetical protein